MAEPRQKPPDVGAFRENQTALGPYGTWPYLERRTSTDRRAGPTRLFSRYLLRGQRLGGRRQKEGENEYVDRYHPHDVGLAVTILILNILDAFFTLQYLDGDLGKEANPVARHLLTLGVGWFIFSKGVVVALCMLFLMVHKTFRFVRPALWFLLTFYGLLLVYHVYLKLGLPGSAYASGM